MHACGRPVACRRAFQRHNTDSDPPAVMNLLFSSPRSSHISEPQPNNTFHGRDREPHRAFPAGRRSAAAITRARGGCWLQQPKPSSHRPLRCCRSWRRGGVREATRRRRWQQPTHSAQCSSAAARPLHQQGASPGCCCCSAAAAAAAAAADAPAAAAAAAASFSAL